MEGNTSESGKRVALETLSKEELIKRCERLLVLAQKAKQAKDSLQEENNELKSKLKGENGGVTNEIVERLTEQKLVHVTTIEDLKKQNHGLSNQLQKCVQDLQASEEKVNSLDSENVSFKRQIKRLTDENEQLISHLETLEKQMEECKKLGLEQQNQLLLLEKSNAVLEDANKKLKENNSEELQKMLNISLQEVKKLQSDNGTMKDKIDNLKLNLAEKDKNILTISQELQSQNLLIEDLSTQLKKKELVFEENAILAAQNKELHDTNVILQQENSEMRDTQSKFEEIIEKLKERLRSYHGKIVKFAGNVRVLKEDKNEILRLFMIYTKQVEEWKDQLSVAALKLSQQINNLTVDNLEYLNQIRVLKESNAKFLEQLEAHKTDDEKSKELHIIDSIKEENTKLSEETEKLLQTQHQLKDQIESLMSEKNNIHKQLTEAIERHQEELAIVNGQSKIATDENKRLSEEIERLLQQHSEYKDQIESLTVEKDNINETLSDAINKHQEEIKVFSDQNQHDTLEIQNHIKENEKICIEYRKIISKFEEDAESTAREINELKHKNCNLQQELNRARETEQQFAEKTSEEILKLVQENADLLEANRKLQEGRDVKEEECQTEETELEEVVTSLKRENSELLTDMNEMNQALKERGETISKFQAHCEEIMKKLQIYETQANKNVDNISQKEEIIKSLEQQIEDLKNERNSEEDTKKDAEIAELKNEIEALKERINGNLESSYAESENMSTSTISRSEENNRLKDLEGSWEERYGKLRTLAVKLKGKVRDLSNELLKEQNEKNDLQQKCANNIKTISTLQTQCDQLHDELENNKKQNKDYSNKLDLTALDISKDKQKLAQNDEVIAQLRKELDELNQEKINTEAWKKQISGKVQTFRKELEANKVLKKEFEAKIAKLTSELEAKEQALKVESDGHQQTRTSLEHSNNERMKNSVLNLEMQDYERSVKELSQKIEKKQEEITKLKSQLESQKSTANAIREQNKLLEERCEEMKNDVTATQSEIISYKKQVSELEEVVLVKENKIHDMTQLLETVRSENEELSTELSKVIAEHQKHNNSLKNEKEHLRSQVLGLQQSLREVQDTLKLKEDELKIVQNDYDTYKVRAQSVLRQNQNRDVGLEEKRSEELSALQVKCEALASELRECKDTIEALKRGNQVLLQEKNTISGKYEDVASEVEDVKSLYEQLSSKHQQTIIEHGETVRSLKVHAETLAQCYRQQLSEQEVRHNREIIELQSKIEKAPSPTELPFPPLFTMHREEGEGSESTENSKSMHPVPLERLLGTDTDQEVAFIKKQLSEEESKVIHLTALLADTEQDLAKHVQMNKLLKEEIRRQQRSVEREKHAENLEYLKNVVFKFVTLHSGDERTRLVPVLNTILKLSPEETQKLTMVAKGDPGIRGWTNYLPTWSSPKTT